MGPLRRQRRCCADPSVRMISHRKWPTHHVGTMGALEGG